MKSFNVKICRAAPHAFSLSESILAAEILPSYRCDNEKGMRATFLKHLQLMAFRVTAQGRLLAAVR